VRKNALKHGLAAGPLAQKYPAHQIEALVESIVGPDAGANELAAAHEFARAHLYWQRVIAVQKKMLSLKRKEFHPGQKAHALDVETLLASDPQLKKLSRYERRAFNRRLIAAKAFAAMLV
jgi:hypothetical protein